METKIDVLNVKGPNEPKTKVQNSIETCLHNSFWLFNRWYPIVRQI